MNIKKTNQAHPQRGDKYKKTNETQIKHTSNSFTIVNKP
jgi:hypothetical protein